LRKTEEQFPRLAAGEIELFTYPGASEPATAMWELWDPTDIGDSRGGENGIDERPSVDPSGGAAEIVASEEHLAEETQRSFEAGRELGYQEGKAAEREAQRDEHGSSERSIAELAARLAAEFALERRRYFESVEHEVVKLAMAVAARILRREAQIDPLLLTGAVRVALGQISASTQVRLRVHAPDVELWSEAMAHIPNLAVRPVVVAGEGMRLGDCALETDLGSVDLGLRGQLGEIESRFFDRAEQIAPEASGNADQVAEEVSV
jgi:flagellar assembly protein FliH